MPRSSWKSRCPNATRTTCGSRASASAASVSGQRFDQRDELRVLAELRRDVAQRARIFGLRQHHGHALRGPVAQQRDVRVVPGVPTAFTRTTVRARCSAVSSGRCCASCARAPSLLSADGVLEVDDDAVGARIERLREALGGWPARTAGCARDGRGKGVDMAQITPAARSCSISASVRPSSCRMAALLAQRGYRVHAHVEAVDRGGRQQRSQFAGRRVDRAKALARAVADASRDRRSGSRRRSRSGFVEARDHVLRGEEENACSITAFSSARCSERCTLASKRGSVASAGRAARRRRTSSIRARSAGRASRRGRRRP